MNSTVQRSQPSPELPDDDNFYPHSDGKPLGESNLHFLCIVAISEAVRDLFKDRQADVSVHTDMFWYWEQGNRRAVRAPDLMVLFGVPYQRDRLSYLAWQHDHIVPSVIIETASREQQSFLLGELRDDYERLGVQEYFVFDWSGQYMEDPLLGFRLVNGEYERLIPQEDGSLLSQELNVRLRAEQDLLRFVDVQTGKPIPTRQEIFAQQQTENARLRELLKQAGITPPEAS